MKKFKAALRVLQFLLAPFKLAALVAFAAGAMIYVNYTIDCSGLYQGDMVNRTIVDLLLDGQNVSNYGQMDDRAMITLYGQLVPEEAAPETLALGSSRVMQFTTAIVGSDSFFNCGMTGADYRDVCNQLYAFTKYGKFPKNVLLTLDPWFFRTDSDGLDRRSNAELFDEFRAVALGEQTDYRPEPPSREYLFVDKVLQRVTHGEQTLAEYNITSITLPALVEPAYFQGNLRYYRRQQESEVSTTEDGDEIIFHAISGDALEHNTEEVRMKDGSVWYTEDFRTLSEEKTTQIVYEQVSTFLRMPGYTQFDPTNLALLEKLVDYLQSNGCRVTLLLSPYHFKLYDHVSVHMRANCAGFFEVEPEIRRFAAAHDLPVVGSYRADLLGLTDADFYDGLHVKGSGIAKYFGGLDENGRPLPGSEMDSSRIALDENGALVLLPAE